MQLVKKIVSVTHIRPGEEKLVAILFLHSLFLGFATSFYFVAVNSFFLKKVSISSIPVAYIVAGIIGTFLMTLYRFIQRKAGVSTSFIAILGSFSLICILLFFCNGSAFLSAQGSLYIAYLGFILVFPFSVLFVVGFSGFCLQIFDLSQSKRLSALIGTGEVLASIIGYLSIPFLLKYFHSSSVLFIIAAVAVLLSIIPLVLVYKKNRQGFYSNPLGTKAVPVNLAFLRSNKFYTSIALVTLLSVTAVYLTDYSYLIAVRAFSELSGIEISIIISFVFGAIKIGELLFSLLSANIINARGMKFSMVVLPAALLFTIVLIIILYVAIEDVAFFLIVFFLLNKWNERVIRKGITVPAMKVVFQVAEPAKRAQIQTTIEGVVSQVSVIIAGILLFIITKWQANHTPLHFLYSMALVSVVFFGAWLFAALKLHAHYKTKVQAYLHSVNTALVTQNQSLAGWKNNMGETKAAMLRQPVLHWVNSLHTATQEQLLVWISWYNTTIAYTIHSKHSSVDKKIIAAYFTNDHFFSRQLIIRYLQYLPSELRQKVAKEMYEVSNLPLRLLLLQQLQKQQFTALEEDRFYYTNLCTECVGEIVWAQATLNDLTSIAGNDLHSALLNYQLTQKEIVLALLSILYDAKAIQVIREILNAETNNKENEIFAVELFENILGDELKDIVIPIFEPLVAHAKRSKLEKHFAIYTLPASERLVEVLMKDFKLINTHTKQLALQMLHKAGGNSERVIKAFASSSNDCLRETASELLHIPTHGNYLQKQKALARLQLTNYFSQDGEYYLLHHGFYVKEGKFSKTALLKGEQYVVVTDDELQKQFEVDTLAMALLLP